jgi:hypothetical protein
MSIALQWLIVAPLIVAAMLFAVWRLLTARVRLRVLSGLLAVLPQSGWPWTGLRVVLMRRVSREAAGCAACSRG